MASIHPSIYPSLYPSVYRFLCPPDHSEHVCIYLSFCVGACVTTMKTMNTCLQLRPLMSRRTPVGKPVNKREPISHHFRSFSSFSAALASRARTSLACEVYAGMSSWMSGEGGDTEGCICAASSAAWQLRGLVKQRLFRFLVFLFAAFLLLAGRAGGQRRVVCFVCGRAGVLLLSCLRGDGLTRHRSARAASLQMQIYGGVIRERSLEGSLLVGILRIA